jgi:hypothetical protein
VPLGDLGLHGERRVVGVEVRGERGVGFPEAIVVLRDTMFVVSVEGGGGKFARIEAVGRTVARQRKHSPVP